MGAITSETSIAFRQYQGAAIFDVIAWPVGPGFSKEWRYIRREIGFLPPRPVARGVSKLNLHFIFERHDPYGFSVWVPHWFIVLSSLGLGSLFAFKRHWRFTTRGLLIATTLIAAALGLEVWAN